MLTQRPEGGKQTRKSAKTFNWEAAQAKARNIEEAELGLAPALSEVKRLDAAISLFMASKRGEDLAEKTLYKHTLTLNRLQAFCDHAGVYYVKDITLAHLTSWRAEWSFESPLAKRVTKSGSNRSSSSAMTRASSGRIRQRNSPASR